MALVIPKGYQSYGTGRRKTSTARVFFNPVSSRAEPVITVNGRPMEQYFTTPTLRMKVMQPLHALDLVGKVSLKVTASGGGMTGQAEAVRMGLARALDAYNSEHHAVLRKEGFLTRDSRKKERKNVGCRGSRRVKQHSKR